jgi:hypothetical protein
MLELYAISPGNLDSLPINYLHSNAYANQRPRAVAREIRRAKPGVVSTHPASFGEPIDRFEEDV